MATVDPLENCTGFDWDDGNTHKNWERNRVAPEEAEDVFFREPLVIRSDLRHSKREKRYYALGQTGAGRRLYLAHPGADRIDVLDARRTLFLRSVPDLPRVAGVLIDEEH